MIGIAGSETGLSETTMSAARLVDVHDQNDGRGLRKAVNQFVADPELHGIDFTALGFDRVGLFVPAADVKQSRVTRWISEDI